MNLVWFLPTTIPVLNLIPASTTHLSHFSPKMSSDLVTVFSAVAIFEVFGRICYCLFCVKTELFQKKVYTQPLISYM